MTNYSITNFGADTSTGHFATQISGLITGETISAGSPVEIREDGRLYKASGVGAFVGIATRSVLTRGQGLTVRGVGQVFRASNGGLIPGATYFVAADGKFSDEATAIDTQGAFFAFDANDLVVARIGKLA